MLSKFLKTYLSYFLCLVVLASTSCKEDPTTSSKDQVPGDQEEPPAGPKALKKLHPILPRNPPNRYPNSFPRKIEYSISTVIWEA